MRYCPTDQQMVETEKEFSWPWALAWLILGAGWGVLIYLVYYVFKSETKCVRCGSETLSSPPPGYVENPQTTAQYIPEQVAQRQQELHQPNQSQLSARAQHQQHLPSDGRPEASLPAGEEWEDVSPMAYTTCPNCHHRFSVQKERPLEVTCPSCGTSGLLPADEGDQPDVFAETQPAADEAGPANQDADPLGEMPGLGGSKNWERDQLERVGIGTIRELAASSPQRIAQDTDISSSRARDLVERAKQQRTAD